MSFDKPNPLSTKELPKQKLDAIARIEQLPCGVDLKIQFLLVLLEAKPAMTSSLTTRDGSPEAIVQTLREAGLYVELETQDHSNSLIVAQTPEAIQEILSLHVQREKHPLPAEYHEHYGKLVGYPQTAIDAFSGRIPSMGERASWELDPDLVFSITYSQAHCQEELELMRAWTRLIQQHAPNLYQEAHKKRLKKVAKK
ncbi:hypothetical protein EXS71_00700 [Candidatus Uhrbacteria bacterium]|nr:hypothetical protein [Candidatus Uhrbacteria bacterium]